jgi:hypothetical protein
MANSTFLKATVEPFVVGWVSKQIEIELQPCKCPVGLNSAGRSVHFAFDGVSADKSVGLLVSASLTIKPGGVRKLHVDASVLLTAPFERRIMAFISEEVRTNFLNRCDGLLPLSKIQMLVCPSLPPNMQSKIDEFQKSAKAEVGDKGKRWKPGGVRR